MLSHQVMENQHIFNFLVATHTFPKRELPVRGAENQNLLEEGLNLLTPDGSHQTSFKWLYEQEKHGALTFFVRKANSKGRVEQRNVNRSEPGEYVGSSVSCQKKVEADLACTEFPVQRRMTQGQNPIGSLRSCHGITRVGRGVLLVWFLRIFCETT